MIDMVDTKSTPSYSSRLYFSGLQDKSEREALISSKNVQKSYNNRKKMDNGLFPI